MHRAWEHYQSSNMEKMIIRSTKLKRGERKHKRREIIQQYLQQKLDCMREELELKTMVNDRNREADVKPVDCPLPNINYTCQIIYG